MEGSGAADLVHITTRTTCHCLCSADRARAAHVSIDHMLTPRPAREARGRPLACGKRRRAAARLARSRSVYSIHDSSPAGCAYDCDFESRDHRLCISAQTPHLLTLMSDAIEPVRCVARSNWARLALSRYDCSGCRASVRCAGFSANRRILPRHPSHELFCGAILVSRGAGA